MGWRGPLTSRQYETWRAWLDLEMNRPSRADYYTMQMAKAVTVGPVKNAQLTNLDSFHVKFFTRTEPEKKLSVEEITKRARIRSIARVAVVDGKNGLTIQQEYYTPEEVEAARGQEPRDG